VSSKTPIGVLVRSRRTRAIMTTAAAAIAAAAFAGPASAAITTGPVDPLSGFPASYTDDLGNSFELCQDVSGFCIEAPRPDPTQPISVPDNFTPDEEGFWWLADATVPNAGVGLARFAKEAAFDTPGINLGHQVEFSRIRFKFDGLVAGDTYRITHPYGVDELTADPDPKGGGRILFTEDVGCLGAPCGAFPTPANDRITSFLTWDPNVLPAAPAGYAGNGVTPHKVIGSPIAGQNFVRLDHLVNGTPQLVGQTDQFIVQGKMAGPPPAPAPHVGLSTTSLSFGARQVGNASAAQRVTVTNHGTADLAVSGVTLGGTDAADFGMVSDGCTGGTIAPAGSCTVDVQFLPGHTGDLAASLAISDNAPRAPHSVALSGVGTAAQAAPAPAPAPAPASGGGGVTTQPQSQLIPGPTQIAVKGTTQSGAAPRLGLQDLLPVGRVTRATLRSKGLRLRLQLEDGTRVVRVTIFRAKRNGQRTGGPVFTTVRQVKATTSRITLRNRAVKRLKAGRYVARIQPGRNRADTSGVSSSVGFRVR
jgi:hypothetical protein